MKANSSTSNLFSSSPDEQLVSYSSYLRLKEKYNRTIKEKAFLRKMLNEITESMSHTKNTHLMIKASIQSFQANLKLLSSSSSSPLLIQKLSPPLIKNYEAFSTSASFETLEPRLKQFLSISVKRIDEMEQCNKELKKKNEILEDWVNTLKKDNEELKKNNNELNGKVRELERINEENCVDIESKNRIIERTVEVGSCIENMYCNSIVLKCVKNEDNNSHLCSSRSNNNNNSIVTSAIGKVRNEKIICEPMPTFIKFLKHLK